MATIAELCELAQRCHKSGKLPEAEAVYRQVLEVEPAHAAAHHMLGVLAHMAGRHQDAITLVRQAIALDPADPGWHVNLGLFLMNAGQQVEAIACYRQALRINPHHAQALNNLGNALRSHGQLAEAASCFRQILVMDPVNDKGHYGLGNVLREQGQMPEAALCYRRAIASNPGHALAHNNLGIILQNQGQLVEAVACYRQALRGHPHFVDALNNLGIALATLGQQLEAIVCFRQALAIDPQQADVHLNLGNVLKEQGQLAEAQACYRQAIKTNPQHVDAYNNLGILLYGQGQLGDAVAFFRQALRLKPDYAEVYGSLGNALKEQGQLDEAITCYRQAAAIMPDNSLYGSNVLLAIQYRSGVTLADLAQAHAEYERQYAAAQRPRWQPHQNNRDPQRRLRLGFVSADFGQHPLASFLIRALENLDPVQAEVVCYSNRLRHDEVTRRFQAAAAAWRDVLAWNDERLAAQIRADRIDILFDVAGHTAGNRLPVFARKPAPIQVTWLGYDGTTGLAAMDYVLADQFTVPSHAECYYQERVLRMPDSYVCYDPPSYAPAVGPLPAGGGGPITLGSFNNPAKMTGEVIDVWARILAGLPESRLLLGYKGLGDPTVAGRFLKRFAEHGISSTRIECRVPRMSHADGLAQYREVDLALDPFPYGGGVTTCDALWMGVPVVTCPGETFTSRHGLTYLSNMGFVETIATTVEDYVDLAVSLARDSARLAELRGRLRSQMAGSPLCDGKRFAGNLMPLLRDVWRVWLAESEA